MFKHLFVSESSCPCCLQAALIEEAQGSAAKDAAMKLRHGRFNCFSTAFPRPFHGLSTAFPLPFHGLSTAFPRPFHCISTAFPRLFPGPFHCLALTFHCLYTAFP